VAVVWSHWDGEPLTRKGRAQAGGVGDGCETREGLPLVFGAFRSLGCIAVD
jgi:hypothetical protein